MQSEQIELQKKREWGEILRDSYSLYRQNFKEIFFSLIIVVLPLSVTGLVLTLVSPLSGYMMSSGISYLVIFATTTFATAYVKVYHDKGYGNFNGKDVWNAVKSSYWKDSLVMLVLVFIFLSLGIICCVIPAFYISIPFSYVLFLRMHERIEYVKCIEKSISLVRNHWWRGFTVYFVQYIIVMSITILFLLPAAIYYFVIGIHSPIFDTNDIQGSTNSLFTFYGIIQFLSSVLQVFIYPIYTFTSTLFYFDLKERKEGTGLMKKIENIGNTDEKLFSNEGEF